MGWLDVIPAIAGIADTVGGFIANDKATDAAQSAANSTADTNRIVQQIAQRTLDAALANVVDAQGNRTEYDQATNTFRSIPSDTTKRIIDASQTEELRNLTDTAGRNRILEQLAFNNSLGANQGAKQYLDQLTGESPYSAQKLEDQLRERTRLTTNESFDNARSDLLRQATRSGTLSNTGDILGQLAQRQNEQLRVADIDSYINSLTANEELNTSRTNRLLTPYLNLSNVGASTRPVEPSGVADVLSSRLSTKQNTVPQAAGVANAGLVNAGAVSAGAQQTLANPKLYNPNLYGDIGLGFSNLAKSIPSYNTTDVTDRRQAGNTTSSQPRVTPNTPGYGLPAAF